MAGDIPEYDEIKLRIEPGSRGTYRVLAFTADGCTVDGAFRKPWNKDKLENFMLRVGTPRRSVRGGSRSPEMEEARRFGGELFQAIMKDDVASAYESARRVASDNQRGLRVTIQLTNVPELMEIPWEFLYDRPDFLAQSMYTPVVRSLDLKRGRPPRKLTPPLRILGMISSPHGFAALDVDSERSKLEQALSALQAAGKVELLWLEQPTLAALHRRIAARDEIHVFHYIGHGDYDEATQSSLLIVEDEHGNPHEVRGDELSPLLADEHSLRLAVLNSCEGARTSTADPFSGVASSLVQCGIEAVVGMQFEITDEAAVAFSAGLYTALSEGFAVDTAMAQGRLAIFAAGKGVEFATPVLFLRGADARLFDVDTGALPPAPPPAPPDPPTAEKGEPEPAPAPVVPGPTVAGVMSALIRDRRKLAAAAGALLALIVGIVVLTGGGDSGPARGAEREFAQRIDSIINRSRPAFVDVNRVAATLATAGDTSASRASSSANARGPGASSNASAQTDDGVMSLDEAGRTIGEVITTREVLKGQAAVLVSNGPTPQARSIASKLQTAFERSVQNNRKLEECFARGKSGQIRVPKDCLAKSRASSQAASDAKNAFRKRYNTLRRSLGLPVNDPSF